MIASERAEYIRRIREWAKSPEGNAEIARALIEAHEACEALSRSRRVDWEMLHRPMTI